MDQAPTLSVVLPNYNHGHLLPRAIGALLAQDRPADEIIIVDDGSSDGSRAVIETHAARAPSIRALFNEANRGAIPTLKRGIEAAVGRYVYLAAADDWILPGFFRRAVDALEAHPAAGLFCGESVLLDGTVNRPLAIRPPVRPAHHPRFFSAAQTAKLLKHSDNWILTNSCVFRRACVDQAGGLDEDFGSFADGILARKVALTHGFFFAPHVLACWAVFPDGYSRRTALNAERARHFLRLIPERLARDPVFPKWYPAVFANRWRFASARLALQAEPLDHSLVAAIAARSSLDHVALKALRALPSQRLARLATLAWLWLRLRPTSLIGLARTALAGRMRQFQQSKQLVAPDSAVQASKVMIP